MIGLEVDHIKFQYHWFAYDWLGNIVILNFSTIGSSAFVGRFVHHWMYEPAQEDREPRRRSLVCIKQVNTVLLCFWLSLCLNITGLVKKLSTKNTENTSYNTRSRYSVLTKMDSSTQYLVKYQIRFSSTLKLL